MKSDAYSYVRMMQAPYRRLFAVFQKTGTYATKHNNKLQLVDFVKSIYKPSRTTGLKPR